MTPEEKIVKILKQIKNESAINADPRWVRFDFNYHMVGNGVLSEDEERRILFKLEKEGAIKLHLSQVSDQKPKEISVISSEQGEKFLSSPYYWVEILDRFEEVYEFYAVRSEKNSRVVTAMSKDQSMRGVKEAREAPPFFQIANSQVHLGSGDNVGQDKVISKKESKMGDKLSWIKYLAALVTIFGVGWGVFIDSNPSKHDISEIGQIYSSRNDIVATSTINISDILSKALTFDTVVERQDFLKKYIASEVYGEGVVEQISRSGGGFLVDIDIARQIITCFQSGGEENEKKFPFLKGKTVSFFGVFTYQQIFEHGLKIDDCVLQK